MNCSVHPQAIATAFCRTCGRPLCPQCSHSVRGVIYCEDCLASALGDAAPPPSPGPAMKPGPVVPPLRVPDAPSPGLAVFLGFIPGVGAMYNGQFGKAIAHLMVFIGLCWASGNAGHFGWFFGVMIPFWIFYMVFDAYRTAHARELGQPVPTDPFGFEQWWTSDSARAAQVAGNTANAAAGSAGADSSGMPPAAAPALPIGAILLIGLGVLFLLGNMGIFNEWFYFDHLWPLVLIVLGAWLFTRRRSRYNCDCQRCQTRGLMGPAVLVTLGTLFLLDEMRGPVHVRFDKTFPILFIVMGAVLILRRGASGQGHVQYVPPPPVAAPVMPPASVLPERGDQNSGTDSGTEVRNG